MPSKDIAALKRLFPIRGQRVELRVFSAEHIDKTYLTWLHDNEVLRYSNQRFRKHDATASLAYLNTFQDSTNLFLAIHKLQTGEFIGTMTAYISVHHQTADMGLLVGDKNCWGHGIGQDAWITLMSFLLDMGGIRKVTGGTLRCNQGMVRVMQKAGMQLDGIRIDQELVEGIPQDVLHFARFANG